MNDADIEEANLRATAFMSANGVCPACEEPLDPKDPKWQDDKDIMATLARSNMTIDDYAKHLGEADMDNGYHVDCLNDMFGLEGGHYGKGKYSNDDYGPGLT